MRIALRELMLCAALQCWWAFLLGVVLALLRLWLLGALTNDDLHVVLTTGLAQMRDAGKYVTRAIATMSGVTCILLFLGCAYVMAVMFLPITVVFASARTMLTLCGKVFVTSPIGKIEDSDENAASMRRSSLRSDSVACGPFAGR